MTMTEYERMAQALEIFGLYAHTHTPSFSADSYGIYAGPNPAVVSAEHRAALARLGWDAHDEAESFYCLI